MKPDWKQTLHTYLLMTLGTALVSVGVLSLIHISEPTRH